MISSKDKSHENLWFQTARVRETKSVDIVGTIKSSLEKLEFTLVAIIDVEGAFNNASTAVLMSAIASFDINQNLLAWLSHMLSNRQVIYDGEGVKIAHQITCGALQGGILSSLR